MGASARKQLFCKLRSCVGLCGLQMCCFVRWLFILSFLFFCHYVANCPLCRFFTLAPNGFGLRAGGHFEAQNCQTAMNLLVAIPLKLPLSARLLLARVTSLPFLSFVCICPIFATFSVYRAMALVALLRNLTCALTCAVKQMCHQIRGYFIGFSFLLGY